MRIKALTVFALLLASCNSQADKKNDPAPSSEPMASTVPAVDIDSLIGETMDWKTALPVSVLDDSFDLANKDLVVVRGTVNEVCKKKGCWMTLDKGDGEELRITFKDYALFMPMDIPGKEVVIRGIARKDTISVEDLRHFAEDEGKTEEEIAAITEPEVKITFEADGVAILGIKP